MPAGHDILVGAMDILWRPWRSIALWEAPITQPLREIGITPMLVSDHPHLFETSGKNYHTEFRGWEYLRGHGMPQLKPPRPDRRARIDFMPGSDVPVLRQAFQPGDRLPDWCAGQKANGHCLYDLDNDP